MSDTDAETAGAFKGTGVEGGLVVLGILALTSILSAVGVLGFIGWRIVRWRNYYKSPIANNQYILLIMSLLVADLIQALSFVISFHWHTVRPIGSNKHWCTAQGVMIHLGDVASAFFVLAIALHTWYQVGLGRKLDDQAFNVAILVTWITSILLTVIAPAAHGSGVYVASGAWCWIDQKFEGLRLGTHYVFIFLIEFAGLLIYGLLFLKLRRSRKAISKMSAGYDQSNDRKITNAARLMAIYPVVYMVLTAPLAISRMASYGGAKVPQWTWIMAGSFLTSSGWADALLYAFTRRALLRDDFNAKQGSFSDWDTFDSRRPSNGFTPRKNSRPDSSFTAITGFQTMGKSYYSSTTTELTPSPSPKPLDKPHVRKDSFATTQSTISSTVRSISPSSLNKPLPKPIIELQTVHKDALGLNNDSPTLRDPFATRPYPTRSTSKSPTRSPSRAHSILDTPLSASTSKISNLFRMPSRGSRAPSPSPMPQLPPLDMKIKIEKEVSVESQPRADLSSFPARGAEGKGTTSAWS